MTNYLPWEIGEANMIIASVVLAVACVLWCIVCDVYYRRSRAEYESAMLALDAELAALRAAARNVDQKLADYERQAAAYRPVFRPSAAMGQPTAKKERGKSGKTKDHHQKHQRPARGVRPGD